MLLKRNQIQNPAQSSPSADSQLSVGALTVAQLLKLTEHGAQIGSKKGDFDEIFVDTLAGHVLSKTDTGEKMPMDDGPEQPRKPAS
jgi:hypothetical protein